MATLSNLTQENEQRLEFIVSRTGQSKASILREIIERGLEDIEDYCLAAEVELRIRNGQEKIHSAIEVMKSLGLDSR